ncbi:outer membrane receptor protein [Methylophilaceae bacterium 11]|nr:outer membrane receptor protein [Methylophilaceae bacterium 11]
MKSTRPTVRAIVAIASISTAGFTLSIANAATLNTKLPSESQAILNLPVTVNQPSQPLASALKVLSATMGVNITFNDALTSGKNAPAIKGVMTRKEALQKLLGNSGLEAKLNETTIYIQQVADTADKTLQLDQISVRAKRSYDIGPMPGLGLTKEEIPGNVQSITAKEIKESHALSLTDLMNSKLQSVTVNDYQSNPFQMDLQYRGFTASPQLGTAQGISVFLDGIRVNEPFGDVVNWDMLPLNALSGLDIFPGSNPIFGLGTLGGALAMRTKSGFDGQSLDAEVLTGSFGRKQLQLSAGGNNGVIAGFVSGNFFMEDGWRDNSPSKVNQLFGKAEWQNERARMGLSMLYAGNKLTGNGLLPEQMVDQSPKQVYTSPDKSKNDLLQFQLSGVWDVTDTFNITGQIYNRKSKRKTKTTDVNENFSGYYTPNAQGRQVLYGYSDINNDGLPDYNTYALNVAADANGFALDINGNPAQVDDGSGNFIPNAAFDVNNLAIGTNFDTPVAGVGQATIPRNDGLAGPDVPRWTADPRMIDNNVIYNFTTPATILGLGQFNNPLPTAFYQLALNYFQNQAANAGVASAGQGGGAFAGTNEFGGPVIAKYYLAAYAEFQGFDIDNSYVDDNGFFNRLIILDPVNLALRDPDVYVGGCDGTLLGVCAYDANGYQINRDGAYGGMDSQTGLGTGTGVIDGTPTAIISETEVDQLGKGAAVQFNWNLDKHKFMLGTSVDMADAGYTSGQYLGMLDAKRNGYEAPNELGYEFYARDAAHALRLNDFSGDSITKSIYASETWKPIETLSVTAAARFNWTNVKNSLDVNSISKFLEASLGSLRNEINPLALCRGVDNDGDGLVDGTFCPTGIDSGIYPFDPNAPFSNLAQLETTPTEKFKYRSFNPSFGATWQAREDLNLYGNWSRGARTPTNIELGCAYDATLVPLPGTSPVIYQERSIADRRTCNLPTTMSGDPHLKQVRSTSMEFGARGTWGPNIEWNTSIYRTDLTDDIYFVSIAASRSFFQNIGDTKRQGLEMGVKGKWGNASFGVNYALTDATFQSSFDMLSPYNSTAYSDNTQSGTYVIDGKEVKVNNFGKIRVNKGSRMPGVPLHNLNFNFGYELTSKWHIGLNAVVHSEAFIRGNENNKHRAGPASTIRTDCIIPDPNNPGPGNFISTVCDIPRANWRDGKTAGYTVFNLQSSYQLSPEWTLGMQINNLFDKEYASAGRLGLNAFSPGVNGAIGPSGFNYNSSEWQGTSFLGTGAPRSAFFTLSYQFKPDAL